MLDVYWKIFAMTGNVESYLLVKELERDSDEELAFDDTDETGINDTQLH